MSWQANNTECNHVQLCYYGLAHIPPQKCPFLWEDLDPHLVHVSMDSHESTPQWHLDRFSHFCTTHPCAQHTQTDRHMEKHTDRQTDRQTQTMPCYMWYLVCSNRPHLCTVCRRCGLKKIGNKDKDNVTIQIGNIK